MRLILFLFFALISNIAFCQFEFSAGVTYEIPFGELGDVYQNTPAYHLTILKGKKYKKKRDSYGVRLGYLNMKPKTDTLVYTINSTDGVEYGMISYDDYRVIQLMGSWRHDQILGKKLEFFYGVDAGLHQTFFSYTDKSPYRYDEASESIFRIAINPKTGINYVLAKHFVLGASASYTISIGNTEDPKSMINQYFSPGMHVLVRL